MRLIGSGCKYGDVLSQRVLIGRGLFLLIRVKVLLKKIIWLQALFCETVSKIGVYGDEVTPVPIPNTEVKLICDEDT